LAHVEQEAAARDAGLRRQIGVWGFSGTLINGVIGGGIFAAPAAMAASVGAWAPLALLACGIAMGAIVLCCAEAGSRVPSSGGIYAFVEAAFGPFWGFVCGAMLWISCVLAAAGVAAAFADAIVALWPVGPAGVQRAALLIGVMVLIAAVNLRGAEAGARFAGLFTVAKLAPLLLFVVIGAGAIEPANLKPAGAIDLTLFGQAMILAVFALSGMETVLGASGEVARPERTLPRALMLSMAAILLLYIAIQIVAQGLLGDRLPGSAEPLAEAIGQVAPELMLVVAIGAAISRGGWLFSDALGAPRFLFAFGRDGFLPSALGRLNARHVPANAIVVHVLIALVLAFAGTFGPLVLLSALTLVPIYVGACLAALKLRRDGVELAGPAFRMPGLPVAAAIGVLTMVAMVAVSKWTEIVGLAAAMLLSALIYLARSRRIRLA
jgi:amino acid transporter